MTHPTRNLTTDWRPGDAEKLAKLETEADVAWPGGGGYQTTAEEEERHIRQSDLLGAFVTEADGQIVSICTLNAKPAQKEHAFIPHLNCHPKYHGEKHGKSVLYAAVGLAYEAGYQKVDLFTWAGNLKAVPLYKKTGFMWRPESSVQMENYTLAARRHPLGRAYFSRHDWYETQVRELTLEEDLVERGNVKVYEYFWRAENGEFLRMVFDRQSWRPVEVENNDLLASCSLPDEKLVAGVPHPVKWRVVNRKRDPIQVYLTASGDAGVEVEKQEVLTVTDEVEVEATFQVDPSIKEKTQDPKAAILRTSLVIGETDIQLAAGIDVQQAVSVSLDAPRAIHRPGVDREAVLTLRSNMDSACTARVSVAPAGGIIVRKREHRVTLKPKGGAEIHVPVLLPEAGPAALDVDVKASAGKGSVHTKTHRVDLLAVEPGGVAGGVGDRRACLCGGGLAVDVDLRYGGATVYHLLRGKRSRRLDINRPGIGPPFSWSDLFDEKAEAWTEQEAFGVTLCLRTKSILRPGLMLERRITLGEGPIVKVVDTIINGSARSFSLSLKQSWYMHGGMLTELVVPRRQGVYRRDFWNGGGRTLRGLNLPTEGEAWPEGWACLERDDGCAAGVLWGAAERVEAGGRGEIQVSLGQLGPGQSTAAAPVYGFVGDGNWKAVRGWWQTLVGGGPPEDEAVEETRRPIELGITPSPLLMRDEGTRGSLFLRHVGEHKLDGKLVLSTGAGLKTDVRSVKVKGMCEARPVTRRVAFSMSKRAKAGSVGVDVRFENEEAIYRANGSALILARQPAEVCVTREDEGKVFTIDNGILTARVAPGFRGSVVSLKRDGKEYLNSGYPNVGIRGWENPWHGGLLPRRNQLWGTMHRERFRCRAVRRKGGQGLVWQGVRVTCTFQQERARGQSIAVDYLLAPGADVLAVIPGCSDDLGVQSHGQISFIIYPSFAASAGNASFHSMDDDSITMLASPHWLEGSRWRWGGIVGRDGRALFLSARGEGAMALGQSMGDQGCILYGGVERRMPAGGRIEGLFFLAPTIGLEDAKAHEVWSEFDALP